MNLPGPSWNSGGETEDVFSARTPFWIFIKLFSIHLLFDIDGVLLIDGLDELLGYSAVCGTGLDVIPLPGDISVEKLKKILLDVASISLKLDKPLSARLILVKGKKAGEDVDIAPKFLVATKVMKVK